MKAGAHDFVLKHQLARLNSAIQREMNDRAVRANHRSTVTQLRTTNQELGALINASPMAIITLDQQRIVRRWNPAAQAVLGWTRRK
ncbi:MAG: PAS domain-containing protein [Minicystis sp.]